MANLPGIRRQNRTLSTVTRIDLPSVRGAARRSQQTLATATNVVSGLIEAHQGIGREADRALTVNAEKDNQSLFAAQKAGARTRFTNEIHKMYLDYNNLAESDPRKDPTGFGNQLLVYTKTFTDQLPKPVQTALVGELARTASKYSTEALNNKHKSNHESRAAALALGAEEDLNAGMGASLSGNKNDFQRVTASYLENLDNQVDFGYMNQKDAKKAKDIYFAKTYGAKFYQQAPINPLKTGNENQILVGNTALAMAAGKTNDPDFNDLPESVRKDAASEYIQRNDIELKLAADNDRRARAQSLMNAEALKSQLYEISRNPELNSTQAYEQQMELLKKHAAMGTDVGLRADLFGVLDHLSSSDFHALETLFGREYVSKLKSENTLNGNIVMSHMRRRLKAINDINNPYEKTKSLNELYAAAEQLSSNDPHKIPFSRILNFQSEIETQLRTARKQEITLDRSAQRLAEVLRGPSGDIDIRQTHEAMKAHTAASLAQYIPDPLSFTNPTNGITLADGKLVFNDNFNKLRNFMNQHKLIPPQTVEWLQRNMGASDPNILKAGLFLFQASPAFFNNPRLVESFEEGNAEDSISFWRQLQIAAEPDSADNHVVGQATEIRTNLKKLEPGTVDQWLADFKNNNETTYAQDVTSRALDKIRTQLSPSLGDDLGAYVFDKDPLDQLAGAWVESIESPDRGSLTEWAMMKMGFWKEGVNFDWRAQRLLNGVIESRIANQSNSMAGGGVLNPEVSLVDVLVALRKHQMGFTPSPGGNTIIPYAPGRLGVAHAKRMTAHIQRNYEGAKFNLLDFRGHHAYESIGMQLFEHLKPLAHFDDGSNLWQDASGAITNMAERFGFNSHPFRPWLDSKNYFSKGLITELQADRDGDGQIFHYIQVSDAMGARQWVKDKDGNKKKFYGQAMYRDWNKDGAPLTFNKVWVAGKATQTAMEQLVIDDNFTPEEAKKYKVPQNQTDWLRKSLMSFGVFRSMIRDAVEQGVIDTAMVEPRSVTKYPIAVSLANPASLNMAYIKVINKLSDSMDAANRKIATAIVKRIENREGHGYIHAIVSDLVRQTRIQAIDSQDEYMEKLKQIGIRNDP